jgi:hypothetical protein
LMPGTTVETLGSASADGWTTALVLVRLTLEPGAMIPDHTHPGTAVITVESGVLQTELVRGTAILSRKPANGAGSVPEAVERGTTLLLNPGDSISYDASAWKTIENSGAGSLTLLASMLVDADRPLISFVAPPRQFNPHLQ